MGSGASWTTGCVFGRVATPLAGARDEMLIRGGGGAFGILGSHKNAASSPRQIGTTLHAPVAWVSIGDIERGVTRSSQTLLLEPCGNQRSFRRPIHLRRFLELAKPFFAGAPAHICHCGRRIQYAYYSVIREHWRSSSARTLKSLMELVCPCTDSGALEHATARHCQLRRHGGTVTRRLDRFRSTPTNDNRRSRKSGGCYHQ